MRFYSRTAFVNAFFPKNLKRVTPVSDFHFLLRSALRFHCSCARVLSAFSFLFTIVSFVHHSFSFLTSLALVFSFLTSLAHLHFRLLFHCICCFIFGLRWSVPAPPPPPLPPPPLSRASATLITSNLGSRKGWCSI